MPLPSPDFITEKELAALLHRHPQTMRGWRLRGKAPPYYAINGRPFYRSQDVELWLKERRR